ncbi:hypothetical protein JCM9279_005435 [Rhodotorula babjevae]
MGLSKKDARTREQKEKAAKGIKVETTAAGVPKKAAKPMIQCTVCKAMIIASMPVSLRECVLFPPAAWLVSSRADALASRISHCNKHPKVTPAECFPGATLAP